MQCKAGSVKIVLAAGVVPNYQVQIGTVAHPRPAVQAGTLSVGSCQSGRGSFCQNAPCSLGGPKLPERSYGIVSDPCPAVRAGTIAVGSRRSGQGWPSQDASRSCGRNYCTAAHSFTAVRAGGRSSGQLLVYAKSDKIRYLE